MSKITIPGVRIGDSLISPASSDRNLVGMFDTDMAIKTQITPYAMQCNKLSHQVDV